MVKIFGCCGVFLILIWSTAAGVYGQFIYGQPKDRVEVVPKISPQSVGRKCQQVQAGRIVFFLQPDYPPEALAARVGGTVVVNIKLNEEGIAPEIERVSGPQPLQATAIEAARKVKFTPTVCDGVSVPVRMTMNYNFIPIFTVKNYFKASKIEDFTDVKIDSQFYEAILNLTENYKIAFGSGDGSFNADSPLTRGELANFLRLTLDLLDERARAVGKFPREIGLFNSSNPQNIKTIGKIKNLGKGEPFFEAVKALLLKYDVAPVNEKSEFQGRALVTQNDVVNLWTKVFGSDAVPVNFDAESGERIMTRGEFALFLEESLGILTYKVLP